ncbi:hypothetical protein Q8A67_015745 [Cirrhinus molitorella]|uniref:Uncharacterized protein n=1 Tax=Cirrhinus molitorella TaxID=172907 RepID=A0AA88PIC4_9TELE|nr:hypothetical protein Q8A67_015745 [Cirrhinus molitorella]
MRGREGEPEREREEKRGRHQIMVGCSKRTYLMSCAASDRHECQSIIATLGGRRREESAGRDRSQTGVEETSRKRTRRCALVSRRRARDHLCCCESALRVRISATNRRVWN